MGKHAVVLAAVAVVCLGLSAYGMMTCGSSGSTSSDGAIDDVRRAPGAHLLPAAWTFDLQRTTVYQLRYTDRITFRLQRRGPVEQRVELNAKLHLRVLANSGNKVRCALQLSDVRLDLPDRAMARALQPLYGEMFVVTMSGDGAFSDIHLPLNEADQEGLRRLMGLLQIVLADPSRYTRTEPVAGGSYRAEYQRRGLEISKARVSFMQGQSADESTQIVASRIEAQVDPRGNWLLGLRARERVRVLEGGRVTVENATVVKLSKLDEPPDPALPIWSDLGPARLVLNGIAQQARARPSVFQALKTQAARDRVRSRDLTLHGVLARLRDTASGDSMQALRDLEALVVVGAEDEGASDALAAACRGASAAQVISVLEHVGNGMAQSVLRGVLRAAGSGQDNRVRATIALGGLERPDRDTTSLLRHVADTRRGRGNAILSDTAILALGALAAKTDARPREELQQYLIRKLGERRDAGGRKAVLLAMQNAGIDPFVDQVVPFLRSGDRLLRLTAATVLEGTSSQAAHAALREALDTETQPKIRQRMQRALTVSRESAPHSR